eukprot:jgi/Chrzof1/3063/Cz12g10110.t1
MGTSRGTYAHQGYQPPSVEDVQQAATDATEDPKVPLLAGSASLEHAESLSSDMHAASEAGPALQPSAQPQVGTAHSTSRCEVIDKASSQHGAARSATTTTHSTGAPQSAATLGGIPLPFGELPNPNSSWNAMYPLIMTWMFASSLALILFAPFFLMPGGMFLGANLAAVMSNVASLVYMYWGKWSAHGAEITTQVKTCMFAGLAACVLDFMTALLNIMVLGNVECEDDEACQSVVAYVFAFFLYLASLGCSGKDSC